ncbi:hypothetical protein DL346_11360 [Paenibacillus montanisoli]|uniref:Uncharacterized protein n=1 Tax=Paenibacillus montanisoli TaxID=2081970 RepID=A0A328U7K7_9BACL|nr:hypothetical protein DL346_11360 [Paenibacillus montanisoli]
MIISTFEHSIEVEQALAVLEEIGVERSSIMTVMMDNNDERIDKSATSHPNKKTMAFEFGMATATAMSVFGISFGFIAHWGPLIWGLLAAGAGFFAGYTITRLMQSRYFKQVFRVKERLPEIAVLINCEENRFHDVQRVLWEYEALSVGTIHA